MGYDIDAATRTDYTNSLTSFENALGTASLDSPTGQEETEWVESKAGTYLQYYESVAALKRAIDLMAVWTVGKGVQAIDANQQVILEDITGNGDDTIDGILQNMVIMYQIIGDSYAEIIRDDDGKLINLKPLDPSTIKMVYNDKGILKRYEQISKFKGNKTKVEFQPIDIFHLSNKRIGDSMHGQSLVKSVEWVIAARREVELEVRKMMKHYVKPFMIFHHKTDNTTEIQTAIDKYEKIRELGEDLHIPEGLTKAEVIGIPSNSTLSYMPWIEYLDNQFYKEAGIPEIFVGGGTSFSESSAKIAYLAFEQSISDRRVYIEKQFYSQVGMKIKLPSPASLRNELLNDESKDGPDAQTGFQPSDTTAGVGR